MSFHIACNDERVPELNVQSPKWNVLKENRIQEQKTLVLILFRVKGRIRYIRPRMQVHASDRLLGVLKAHAK